MAEGCPGDIGGKVGLTFIPACTTAAVDSGQFSEESHMYKVLEAKAERSGEGTRYGKKVLRWSGWNTVNIYYSVGHQKERSNISTDLEIEKNILDLCCPIY